MRMCGAVGSLEGQRGGGGVVRLFCSCNVCFGEEDASESNLVVVAEPNWGGSFGSKSESVKWWICAVGMKLG